MNVGKSCKACSGYKGGGGLYSKSTQSQRQRSEGPRAVINSVNLQDSGKGEVEAVGTTLN